VSREDPKTKSEFLAWVASRPGSHWGPPTSDKSVAVLYSGYQGQNHKAAKKDCEEPNSPRYLIDHTTGGVQLNAKLENSGLSRADQEEIGRAASARFAQSIEGPVETHIISSDKSAIAQSTELAMICADNSRVTTVNGMDRSEVADLARSSQTDAYYAICKTELSQTHERAALAEDPQRAEELNELADKKTTGLQTVVGRDMAWNAQHSADPSTPDETLRFRPKTPEEPEREGVRQVPAPANNNDVEEDRSQGVQAGADIIPPPANDNDLPADRWNNTAPGNIPAPNELSSLGPAASGSDIPPPDDGIPEAPTARPVANDNSVDL